MIQKQILAALLLMELAVLAGATAGLIVAGASLFTQTALALFLVMSLFSFYGVTIQNVLKIELMGFVVGLVVNVIYSLGGLLLPQSMAVALGVGPLAGLVVAANILLVFNSSPREAKKVSHNMEDLQADEEYREPTTLVPAHEFKTATPVTEMLHELHPVQATPNVVNVNVNAANPAPANTSAPFDDEHLLRKSRQIQRSLDDVDDRIGDVDRKTEERISYVKKQIEESFGDVKKELDEVKKQREEKERIFIASKNGKKVHTPDCMVAARIPEEKRVVIEGYEQAIKKGYSSCGVCCPMDAIEIQKPAM